MNARWVTPIALCGALLVGGCDKKDSEPETNAPIVQETEPPPPAVPTAASVELDSIPTEQDFEEEASTSITAATLEQRLEALEKEILAE